MSCPWFCPSQEARFDRFPRPARAPLGTVFAGACHANPASPFVPTEALLRGPCNFGYGRGCCSAFPGDSPADAVRFTVVGARSVWIAERNHVPVAHGPADGNYPDALIARQAEAWRASCQTR